MIEWYKVRLVARGFTQMPGIDFDQVFSPNVKLTSICILCSLAVCLQLHFHHLDVDTAFLNSKLQEELYMCLPHGIGEYSNRLVCLCCSIYSLKQASCVWNQLLDSKLKTMGFCRIHADHCIYILCQKGYIVFLAVYVDDMGLLSNDLTFMQKIKDKIGQCFHIKDLG